MTRKYAAQCGHIIKEDDQYDLFFTAVKICGKSAFFWRPVRKYRCPSHGDSVLYYGAASTQDNGKTPP